MEAQQESEKDHSGLGCQLESNQAGNTVAKEGGDSSNPVILNRIWNVEEKSLPDPSFKEGEVRLPKSKENILGKDKFLYFEKPNPNLRPKLMLTKERIPLSSNAKITNLRNSKFKKEFQKKISRAPPSGKENSERQKALSSKGTVKDVPNEPIANSDIIRDDDPAGGRSFCGGPNGRSLCDSGSSLSESSVARVHFVATTGQPEPSVDDEGGNPICHGRANEGVERTLPVNAPQNTILSITVTPYASSLICR